jgi:cyclophilin family peptidyl-prolyl cis-trans isomerase
MNLIKSFACVLVLAAGGSAMAQPATTPPPATPASAPAGKAPEAVKAPEGDKKPEVKTTEAKAEFKYAVMNTSMGDIVLELDQTKAPISVENFVKYAEKGHYNGTVFHRVIKNFMIQGGGFDEKMNEKPTDAPIKNEWQNGLKNTRGTIAMARKGKQAGQTDNSISADSATSQFYINVVDNTRGLDLPQADGAAYAVFGRVIGGMDVVDRIRNVQTTSVPNPKMPSEPRAAYRDVPVKPVTINSVKIVTKDEAEKAAKPAGAAEEKKPATPAAPAVPAVPEKK